MHSSERDERAAHVPTGGEASFPGGFVTNNPALLLGTEVLPPDECMIDFEG
jgi:hypothetical protein